eukprot:458928-Rhodomonas_salina.1
MSARQHELGRPSESVLRMSDAEAGELEMGFWIPWLPVGLRRGVGARGDSRVSSMPRRRSGAQRRVAARHVLVAMRQRVFQ